MLIFDSSFDNIDFDIIRRPFCCLSFALLKGNWTVLAHWQMEYEKRWETNDYQEHISTAEHSSGTLDGV